jgi:hypothetical protein
MTLHTTETANCDRIVARRLPSAEAWTAVAFKTTPANTFHGHALAVREDGTAYAIWEVIPGPDSEITLGSAVYFDGADYRHLDRMSHGHTGAFAAATAAYAYLGSEAEAAVWRAAAPEDFRDALTRVPAAMRESALMGRGVKFLRTLADLCGADAEFLGKRGCVAAILADY